MIEFAMDGAVGIIRLARPEKRNALTPEALEQLAEVQRWADPQSTGGGAAVHPTPLAEARALLLCGAGRVLCAGFDLDTCRGEGGDESLRRLLRGLSAAIAGLRAQERPVVVAAHGAAIAGGCALLGAADVVVADAGAKLGYPVAPLGISPAVSAPFLAPAVGAGAGRRLLLDPGLIDGREGHRLGLVHELVEMREEVLPRAMEVARELAAKPGEGLGATRRWLDEVERAMWQTDAAAGLAVSESLVGSAASRERLEAMWAARDRQAKDAQEKA